MLLRRFTYLSLLLLMSCRPAAQVPEPSEVRKGKTGEVADSAMVVTAHPEATRVGLSILRKGGNAADAAVAVQFALAVTFPYAGNIAGGGFLVYRAADGQSAALDFREVAPKAAHRDMYLDAKGEAMPKVSSEGILSVGVPGSVDGMVTLHEKYGSLPWAELIQPSIDLAAKGYPLTQHDADWLNKTQTDFLRINRGDPGYFTRKTPWAKGDTMVQKDLAGVLEAIRDQGKKGFYQGPVAEKMIQTMREFGGIMTQADLDSYTSIWREPLSGRYKNYQILTMPPPSGGGIVLLQALGMLAGKDLKAWGPDHVNTVHVMVEVLRRAFADRAEYIGDPAFWKVPENLLDSAYLADRMRDFQPDKATPSQTIAHGQPAESDETTHFSILDPMGNAISVTTTVNGPFGSKVFVKGGGFLLNNEMDDFSIKPGVPNIYGLIGNEANAIAPGKRMASSMSPTIVSDSSGVRLIIGTPGGSTIPVSVLQVFLLVLEHDWALQAAVEKKRFHHQWLPDEIAIEEGAFSDSLQAKLNAMGHKIRVREAIGRVAAILIWDAGLIEGSADPRRDDCAAGF